MRSWKFWKEEDVRECIINISSTAEGHEDEKIQNTNP